MRTSVEPLEGNKVKLTVEVDEDELRGAVDETMRRLVREVRLPGFRPGKVPRRLIESRLGPKAIREEVLRDALPRYYSEAVEETALDVIASPEIDVTAGSDAGNIVFDAVVEVRPEVSVAGYEGLVVTVPSLVPTPDEIDAQVDRLREQFATLTEVEREAREGDLVTLDVHGSRAGKPAEGLTADDLVYEVGSGGLVEGADAALLGKRVGDVVELRADDAPGGPADLRILVKQVREKLLPDADDAFAADASEFETMAQLREDIERRLFAFKRAQARSALREGAIEALVGLVAEEPPASLVQAETQELLHGFSHRLEAQRVGFEEYLDVTGQEAETFLTQVQAQAAKQVKADLALRALAVAEGIEVDESDIDEEIVRLAQQANLAPARLREQLERDGRIAGLRSQLRNSKALEWLVEHVGTVDEEGNPLDRSLLLGEDGGGDSLGGDGVPEGVGE
jgi:trigger factor